MTQSSVERKEVIISKTPLPNGKTQVRVLDAATGMPEADYYADTKSKLPGRPPGKKNDIEFFRVYRGNWSDIVRNKRLTLHEAGLFFCLLGLADWNTNRLVHPESGNTLSLSELSLMLKIERKHLGNCVHTLAEKGMLTVTRAERGANMYVVINSQVAYYGKYMPNMDEHQKFYTGECGYEPVVEVKYRQPKTR